MNDLQAKSTNTLALCPFCGGEAECHQWWSATISGKYATVCTKCNCGTDFYATEAEAIAAWNSRAERTCRILENFELPYSICSECGAIQPDDFTVYYCWACGAKVRNE